MILVVMGVSGSGKTSVGRKLAEALGAAFVEGDRYHPPSNVAKMSAGTPLTDEDRWPWLRALRDAMDALHVAGRDVVATCSALKQSYRNLLAEDRPHLRFVYLKGSEALIGERLKRRKGHFMPPELLHSQFVALEEPRDAITVDITPPVDDIVAAILARLGRGKAGGSP
ncbi:MAG TPA: gluconokinase [Alphaproteobacteria bacterium]|nr:gluconokinase [Alphaproteobacteria bacterium]